MAILRTIAKTQRLLQLLKLLRLKEHTTAQLAERLNVPVRTVQRDLQTLRTMGEAIEQSRRGRYRLLAVATALNPVEALAVHAATRLLHHHAPTRNQHYVSALEKLAALLPEPARSIALTSVEKLSERPGDDRALELAARALDKRNS